MKLNRLLPQSPKPKGRKGKAMKLTKLIDLVLAVAIGVGALHVGKAVIDWAAKTNTPFGAVVVLLEGK